MSVLTSGLLALLLLGDYHDVGSLDCSECHVMHPAKPGVPDDEARFGASPELLREDINDLCLSCHDDSRSATDVLGPNTGRYPGDLRQAGYLNRLGVSGFSSTGHTLGSLDPAPGSQPVWRASDENASGTGLNCINCHAPHGVPGGYRNLRPDAGNNSGLEGLVRYNHERPGTNDLSRDVFVRVARSYDESAVDFNEPDPSASAMGRFCAGCHDAFHGGPGASGPIGGETRAGGLERFLRHPGAGVDIGASGTSGTLFGSGTNRLKVMSEVGVWDPPGIDASATCITCHKAHGNGNAFGLIYRSGRGVPTENGDTQGGTLEALCAQCHDPAAGP